MTQPQAEEKICVLPTQNQKSWQVSICTGSANRKNPRLFATREEALEFAMAERDRLRTEQNREITVHLPDDCPCYFGD